MKRARVALAVAVVVVVACLAWRRCNDTTAPATPTVTARVGTAHIADPHTRRDDPRRHTRASISGVVRDSARAPIAHAQVCADVWTNSVPLAETREPTCTETDAAGRYRIADLIPAGTYTAVAAAPQFVPLEHPQFPLAAGENLGDVDFVLARGGVELTGAVSSVTGEPIAHAHVRAWNGDRTFSGPLAIADEHGRFTLWVAPGPITAGATADGYTEATADARAPGVVALKLSPESSISGIVIDAATREPVEGARVVPLREDGEWANEQFDLTDERGAFRIARLTPERYVVEASTDHGRGRSRSVGIGFVHHVEHVVIELAPAHRVEGRVVIAGDRRGCPSPTISLTDPVHHRMLGGERDGDGSVHVDGVPTGAYAVHVGCEGFVVRARVPVVVVADRDVSDLVWEVGHGATIRGTVRTRRGARISGAEIFAAGRTGGASATSGTDGAFELAGLAADSYALSAGVGRAHTQDSGLVEVGEGATLQRDIVLDDNFGAIVGRVVDDHGAPVRGYVRIAHGGDDEAPLECEFDGTFASGALTVGDYTVEASADQTWSQTATRQVSVRAGETVHAELVVQRPTGVIAGVVLEADGRPAADVWVGTRADEQDGDSETWWGDGALVRTSSTGAFRIVGLSPGTHTIHAVREGGEEAVAHKVAVGSTATLRFLPTGSIAGVVRSSDGVPLVGFTLEVHGEYEVRSEHFERSDGQFVVADLAAGHYDVVVETESGGQRASLELGAGQARTGVDLVLEPLPTLTGRVVTADTHQPIDGARLLATGCRSCGTSPVTTDAAGRFTIEHVARGEIELLVNAGRASGFAGRMVDVTVEAHTVDLGDIELERFPPY